MNKILHFLHGYRLGAAKWLRFGLVLLMLVGGYRLVFYSLPMHQQAYSAAAEAGIGDAAVAYYDAALQAYEAGDARVTLHYLNLAFEEAADRTGVIPAHRLDLAAKIRFLAGNTQVAQKQYSEAIESYKDALRFDPTHMYAKYNLEMLLDQQAQGGGGGEGQGQGDGSGNGQQPGNGKAPGRGPRRGI